MGVDPATYRTCWRVRQYELDALGHVNNAVFLNYAEQVAIEHADAAGFGPTWTTGVGGAWVVRRHAITYHRPAYFGDELELTTQVLEMRGARGLRRTRITRLPNRDSIADIETEWVWVRLPGGRPARPPSELLAFFSTSGG
jgi:acyl-CoA thioester hydrolase